MSSSDEDDHRRATERRDSSPDDFEVPLRKPGYIPTNCGKPTAETTYESSRKAYRRMQLYIDKDPEKNCCTIDGNNVLKLYEATELPVKLTKADRTTTFFCSEDLELEH